jgi:hypothetical protein
MEIKITFISLLFMLILSNFKITEKECLNEYQSLITRNKSVVLLKEPYCKACLSNIPYYLDSLNKSNKDAIVFFENQSSNLIIIKTTELITEKTKISKKNINHIERFDCDILNGIYIGSMINDSITWTSFP